MSHERITTPNNERPAAPDDVIFDIAKRLFWVETLDTRHGDSLDFYDVPVWTIKKALQEAYLAGYRAGASDKNE